MPRFFRVPLLMMLMSWVFVASSTRHATGQDVSCDDLSLVACVGSKQCMLSAGSRCVAPWDRCQIAFQQAILNAKGNQIDRDQYNSTINQCQSQTGCKHVPAEECYCPPDVDCICGGGAPPNCLPDPALVENAPIGVFHVVDVRAVSGVATSAVASDFREAIGKTFTFLPNGLSLDGMECDQWDIRQTSPPVNMTDPLLTDVFLGPVDHGGTQVDNRISIGWSYACEGDEFLDILEVDGRVLVAPWSNGAAHLILERQLTRAQIVQLQNRLKDFKFMEAEPTGTLDETTLEAINSWAEYRSIVELPYRFLRTAITANLLAGLLE
jgi:hypothetical protein